MASSVTEVGNPQQGGKKGKDKNKDLAVLVDDKVAEVNDSIITLTGRVDEMEKHIEEFESDGDLEELRGEIQVAVNSIVADVNKEVQAFQASEATQGEELKACRVKIEAYKTRVEALEAQLKVYMAAVANMGASGSSQVSTIAKDNALPTPTYNGARNACLLYTSDAADE